MRKLIFIVFLFPLFVIGQDRTIDSLKLALKNAKHDTTRCNILSILAETASDEEWPAFNEQLKVLAERNIAKNSEPKFFYLKYQSAAFNNIGYLASLKGDIPKALDYYEKSLNIDKKIGDKVGLANTLNNIGIIYNKQGHIYKALEYHHNSLKIREEVGDKYGIGNSLNNIGFIYENQGDIPKALEYYRKGLKFFEEFDNKYSVAYSLNNIGVIYFKQDSFQLALECFYKSLKNREEIGDKQGIAESLSNIGNTYKNQGELSKALDSFQKSLKINEEIGNKYGISNSLNNMANLTLRKGQTKEALVFANRGLQMAKELGFPWSIKSLAQTIKSIFLKQNKYKEAFEMFELEVKMRDSINNEETQKAAVKKQMQYQYETQARELKNEQDKKDLLAKAELQQREKERNYFIIGFALVIVLAGFIFRSYRQKQKANLIITRQKHEVEESRKEILDSIHYAKRIQKAHLPSENYISKAIIRLNKNNESNT